MGIFCNGAHCGKGGFDCWQVEHCLQYCSTSLAMLIQKALHRKRSSVFSAPRWPTIGMSWLGLKASFQRLGGRRGTRYAEWYWKLKMDNNDREKTAFTTHEGLFEFKVMP